MPLAELDPAKPVPYDDSLPHGVRWEFFTPLGPMYAIGTSNILMMLAERLLADVSLRRTCGLGSPLPTPHLLLVTGWTLRWRSCTA
jgi:hypothetical protein